MIRDSVQLRFKVLEGGTPFTPELSLLLGVQQLPESLPELRIRNTEGALIIPPEELFLQPDQLLPDSRMIMGANFVKLHIHRDSGLYIVEGRAVTNTSVFPYDLTDLALFKTYTFREDQDARKFFTES